MARRDWGWFHYSQDRDGTAYEIGCGWLLAFVLLIGLLVAFASTCRPSPGAPPPPPPARVVPA